MEPADAIETAESAARRTTLEINRANSLRLAERFEDGMAVLDGAEPLCARFDLPALMSRLCFTRGNLLFQTGRAAECAAAHDRALAEARRAGSVEAEARALGGLGDAHYMRGAFVSSRAAFAKCVETAAAIGLGEIEADNLPMLAMSSVWLGDLAGARALAERALQLAGTLRRPRAWGVASNGLTLILCELGAFDEAIEVARRALEMARTRSSRFFQFMARLGLSHALELAGRRAEGQAAIEDLPAHERANIPPIMATAVKPRMARLRQDRAALLEAVDTWEFKAWNMGMVWFLPDAVSGCVEADAWDSLARLLDRLAPAMPPEPVIFFTAPVQAARALLALRHDGSSPRTAMRPAPHWRPSLPAARHTRSPAARPAVCRRSRRERSQLPEVAAQVRARAVVRVAELAHDLALLVEVEDVRAVPAGPPAVAGLEQPAHQRRSRVIEVVLAGPADRRLARAFVDDAVIHQKRHRAKRARELGQERLANRVAPAMLAAVARQVDGVVGEEGHHVVEVVGVEACDEAFEHVGNHFGHGFQLLLQDRMG